MHFIYIQHNKRAFFVRCSHFQWIRLQRKKRRRKIFQMENESHALNRIKRNICCVVLNIVVVSLFIYIHLCMLYHFIPYHTMLVCLLGLFNTLSENLFHFHFQKEWFWYLFFFLFCLVSLSLLVWKTNAARKQIVIKVGEKILKNETLENSNITQDWRYCG